MTQTEITKRNDKIATAYGEGRKVPTIGREFGLSPAYVYEVLRKTRNRPTPRTKTSVVASKEATTDAVVPNPYETAALEIAKLVTAKQAAYGDSFGNSGVVLRAMFPNGVPPEKLDSMLTVVRMVDKLFRVANQTDAFGEDPFKDLNGYSLLEVVKRSAAKGS